MEHLLPWDDKGNVDDNNRVLDDSVDAWWEEKVRAKKMNDDQL